MHLNPNHPVASTLRDEWHKLVAALLLKSGQTHVVLTMADIERLPNDCAIVASAEDDGIHLQLVDGATGRRWAREAGGLPL